jgi:hypothetical protein
MRSRIRREDRCKLYCTYCNGRPIFPHDEPADSLHNVAKLNRLSLVSTVFSVVMIYCTVVMRLLISQSVLLLLGNEKLSQSQSQSHIATDGQSVWGLWPNISYSLTVTVLSLGGALSEERDGSVVCQSQSAVLRQMSLFTIYYILYVSHVIEYMWNIYKASVSPGSVQQIMPYFR